MSTFAFYIVCQQINQHVIIFLSDIKVQLSTVRNAHVRTVAAPNPKQ